MFSPNNLHAASFLIKLFFVLLTIMAVIVIAITQSKTRSIKRLSKRIEKKPSLANEIASGLNEFICEIECGKELFLEKIANVHSLVDTSIYKHFRHYTLNDNSILLITLYHYQQTPKANSNYVDLFFHYKYVFENGNKIKIFSHSDKNPKAIELKTKIVKEFFSKYILT